MRESERVSQREGLRARESMRERAKHERKRERAKDVMRERAKHERERESQA